MKNVLLSSLVVVSLLGSANMFAMQGGDASKVQDLITKGKATEQTLAVFAKVPGKLRDKLGISDADYKAYLAQKGGAPAPTPQPQPQPQPKPVLRNITDADKGAILTLVRAQAMGDPGKALTLYQQYTTQHGIAFDDKFFGDIQVAVEQAPAPTPVPTPAPVAPALDEGQVLKAIESIAEAKSTKAEALIFLGEVEDAVSQLRARDSIKSKP